MTYHEACHLCHGQKITRAPREVLKQVPGLQLVELPEATWCCGSAGIYNITQPEMSRKLLRRKLENIARTGRADRGHRQSGMQRAVGSRPPGNPAGAFTVVHPITLLARAYRGGDQS